MLVGTTSNQQRTEQWTPSQEGVGSSPTRKMVSAPLVRSINLQFRYGVRTWQIRALATKNEPTSRQGDVGSLKGMVRYRSAERNHRCVSRFVGSASLNQPGKSLSATQNKHTVTDAMIEAFYAEIDAPVALTV
jgi:hypothetical protein